MAKIDVFNQEAKAVKSIELSDAVFGIEPNQQAMYDAILVYQAGLRQGTRATQWRHGGIAFGPQPRKYDFKLNRKVRQLALRSALSEKLQESSLTVLENLSFDEIKTKKAVALMNAFGFDRKTLFVAEADEDFDNAYVSMRNIPNALVVTVSSLNVYDIVNADKVVFTEKAAEKAGEVFA